MQYLLFLVLPILSNIKIIAQSYIARKDVKNLSDNLYLNALIYLASAIIFSCVYIREIPNTTVLLFSLGFAVATFIFQIFYTLAFRYGPFSLTSSLVSLALIFQILMGLFLYHEELSTLNYFGFIPFVIAFILLLKKNKKEDPDKKIIWGKYLIFALIALIGNGLIIFMQVLFKHQAEEISSRAGEFMTYAYIFAFIMSIPFIFIFKKKNEKLFKLNWKNSLLIVVSGAALILYNFLSVVALTYFPSSLFFPVRFSITVIINFLVDLIFYKEKIKWNQWLGGAFAIIAIVLLLI